jgi:hypothetical protein
LWKAVEGLGGIAAVRALISVPQKEYQTLQRNVNTDTMDFATVQRPLNYRGAVLKEFDRLVKESRR